MKGEESIPEAFRKQALFHKIVEVMNILDHIRMNVANKDFEEALLKTPGTFLELANLELLLKERIKIEYEKRVLKNEV